MQVAKHRTIFTPTDFARAFIRAWSDLGYDEPPTKEQVGVIYAHWKTETGSASCWNFNLGNLKVTPAQVAANVPWFDLGGTDEYIGGVDVVLPPGDPGRRFRAYSCFEEGMSEHVALLKNRQFKTAWPFVEAGDPVGFTHAIKAGPDGREGTWDDYFTAPVARYLAAMQAQFAIWMKSSTYDDALASSPSADETPTLPALPPTNSDPPPAAA